MKKLLRVSIFLLAFFGVSAAIAAPPLGIQGNVTVTNNEMNPVPVVIQGVDEENPVLVSHPTMTHMGQTPQDHVTLSSRDDGVCPGGKNFRRVLPDGTVIGETFVVPAGKVLVATDLNARIKESTNGWAFAEIGNVSLSTDNSTVYRASVAIPPDGKSAGSMAINSTITSGALISGEEPLCAHALVSSDSGSASVLINSILVYGYLIDE
jgi:hypothetical protein